MAPMKYVSVEDTSDKEDKDVVDGAIADEELNSLLEDQEKDLIVLSICGGAVPARFDV